MLKRLTTSILLTLVVLIGTAGCGTVNRNGYFSDVSMTGGGIASGYFLNNRLHGQGTHTYADGNKYVGEFRGGKPNGQGTATFANGSKFVGEFRDGKLHGQGTITYADGEEYVGEFRVGKYNGRGTITLADGNKYVGEFRVGKYNGRGTITLADGNKYVGEFRDGKYNGRGTITLANGNKYVGGFRDNKQSGQGTFTFASGNKYVGEFRDGSANGQGTYTRADESKYVGEFRHGKFNGQGTYYYLADNEYKGDRYVGKWWDGKTHGSGTYTYADGSEYVGEFKGEPYDSRGGGFKDRNFHGQGVLTYADGRVEEGIWESGKFILAQKASPIVAARKSPPEPKPSPPSIKSGSTGSGFFVSKLGHIVTNEHVVQNCGSITVGDTAMKQVAVTLVETDRRNDLALLKISSTKMASAETMSLIRKLGIKTVPLASEGLLRSDDVELGEDVLVSGYPYGDIFSNAIKVTKGIVSANRGVGDDFGQFQIDAAVQPGNSGGPIYDENGNIVGVVVAQLNKLKIAKAIGSLPENVNFGIKASTVRQFLTSAGLPTKWSSRSEGMSTRELAKIAKNQTVMVVCN